jgi:hypothetical protein
MTGTHTAFAHDYTGHPGPDTDTGDDGAYAPPGIAVEDAEGREVAGKAFRWPSGKFAPDFADEALGRMGFRRTGPWEWLGWDWRAPLAADVDAKMVGRHE